MKSEAEQLRAVLADVLMSAVLHPEIDKLELVSREVLDRARFMIDHDDMAASAARTRQRRERF